MTNRSNQEVAGGPQSASAGPRSGGGAVETGHVRDGDIDGDGDRDTTETVQVRLWTAVGAGPLPTKPNVVESAAGGEPFQPSLSTLTAVLVCA